MSYTVHYLESVVKTDIPKLDNSIKLLIKKNIETKLVNNPLEFGKPLQYSLLGCRRLRVGDYRVIFIIDYSNKTVTIVKIGHRKEIYQLI